MVKKQLYLVDATAFCYRAFYALPRLATSSGQPTGAIYGFLNMLGKLLKDNNPEYLAVCFDVSRDTVRQKKFAEYKIQRPPMPDELSGQISLIKDIVSGYGITILQKEGYEADDILATMAQQAREKGFSPVIISSDKDILQLVDDDTRVLSLKKDETIVYDPGKVVERFGVRPGQMTDILALMGDSVDNIPGVPGIGEKTAVELIKEFGSLDNLLENIDQIKKDKIRDSILKNLERVKLNKELVILDKGVDIAFEQERLKIGQTDWNKLRGIFQRLEFKKMLKEIPVAAQVSRCVNFPEAEDILLKDIITSCGELFIYGRAEDDVVFCWDDKIFRLGGQSEYLRAALASPRVQKTGHDIKSLRLFLKNINVVLGGVCFDTMVGAYLVNPARTSYSLDDLSWDYLGKAAQEPLDNQQALDLIKQLRLKIEEQLHEKSLWKLFTDLEMPLVEVLSDMETNGIKIDLGVLKGLAADIEGRLIKLIDDIYSLSETQFNINSPKQLRQILFDKLKLPVVKRSKTGPSTDEEVLRALAPKHKLPALLLEYRQLMKLKNTYIDVLPELISPRTGRLHSSFNQTSTETGRLSSSNPNLQNIPVKTDIGKKIRQAIIAGSADKNLVSCDYSQIELRILAHLSGDDNLIEAFKNGADIHKATASLIYGISQEEITDSMREMAKRVNFGIVYGLTSYGLSRDLGISLDEAQRFIDAYFLKYPKVKDYINRQIDRARKNGFVTTILDRRRYLPEINNKNQSIRQLAERQAVNTPIQGSASDLIKMAMIQIHRQFIRKGLSSLMIMQIHDELVFDVPKVELKEIIEIVRDGMENVLKLDVPIKVDIKIGNNWLDMESVE